MKQLFIPVILFLLLAFEGIALDILPASLVNSDFIFVSHWVFIFIMFVAIFFDREDTHYAILYGILFGLLTDIVYTDVLGVYMFSYAIIAYAVHEMIKWFHANFLVTILVGTTGLLMVDVLINIIFAFIGFVDIGWQDYILQRLLPTIITNLLFLIVLYPIMAKPLSRWKKEPFSKGIRF